MQEQPRHIRILRDAMTRKKEAIDLKIDATPEFVLAAVIHYHGELFQAGNHADAAIALEAAHPEYVAADVSDGYVTSKGRFISREEGYTLAGRRDQISEDRPADRTDTVLDSEHLKPYRQ